MNRSDYGALAACNCWTRELPSCLREPASTGGVVLARVLAPPNLFHARWSKICACNAVKDGRGCYVDVKGNHKIDVVQLRMSHVGARD